MDSEKLAFFVSIRDISVKNPEGVLERLTSFLSDSDADVRAEAVAALGMVNDDAALPLLNATYRTDTSDLVREYALEEMANFKSDAVFELLRQYLGEPELRRRHKQLITQQLMNYNSSESVHLLKTLLTDKDYIVRDYAVDSLLYLNRVSLRRVWVNLLNGKDIAHQNIARKALRAINNKVRLGQNPR